MLFKNFSQFLAQLEETSSRNQMTEDLAELFKEVSLEEIDQVCYLSLGRLAPKYEGLEFNMAEKMMVKAIGQTGGLKAGQARELYKKKGDLGDVIFKLKRETIQPEKERKKVTIAEVYQRLKEIAEEGGEGSVDRKINKMADLLKELQPLSAKYVARIPVNKLRLGFSDMTILDALSWMRKGDKSLRAELERAFNVLADIGRIAKIFKKEGLKGIQKVKSEPGVPIRAALAERLKSPEKILEKMDGRCALEPKMDGFRVQIHLDKTRALKLKGGINLDLFASNQQSFVRIFSRNLDNTTYMFPDIVKAVQKLKAEKAILDGEAIAFDPKSGNFLSFQETVQRKRKHGVGQKAQEVPLKVFVFDLLYLNGQSLLNKEFRERRRLLEKLLEKSSGEEQGIILTEQKIVSRPEEFEAFFKEVVSEGLEGLMAKKLEAFYQAGARNYTWVKYKAAMKSELADTIDCVVMGYYRGKGKRSQFGIGAFLVGVYYSGRLLTVSKIGTGLTDEQWRQMYRKCEKLKVEEKPKNYQVNKSLSPDIWCRPQLVVEIEADTITKSPLHTAGLALRFPRLKRFRDDKEPGQATSLLELKKIAS